MSGLRDDALDFEIEVAIRRRRCGIVPRSEIDSVVHGRRIIAAVRNDDGHVFRTRLNFRLTGFARFDADGTGQAWRNGRGVHADRRARQNAVDGFRRCESGVTGRKASARRQSLNVDEVA